MATERSGDGPNPLSRGGEGPIPLWEVVVRRFGGGDGPCPLALVPLTRGDEVTVRWGDNHQLGAGERGRREASMHAENVEGGLGRLSAAIRAYSPPVRREKQGVWADLDFTSGGPYKTGEKVEYIGGSNIQVEKGEPAGLYLFVFYVFGSDGTGRLFYEHAASYPVVASGTDMSGYSPIIKGGVYPPVFGSYLGPGQYSFTVVIRVVKPNTTQEEELARKASPFIIESSGRGLGESSNPLVGRPLAGKDLQAPDVTLVESTYPGVRLPPAAIEKAVLASFQTVKIVDAVASGLGEPPQTEDVVGTGPNRESVLVQILVSTTGGDSIVFVTIAGRDRQQPQSLLYQLTQDLYPRLKHQ